MRIDSIFNKVAGKRWFSILLLTSTAALLILISLQLGHQLPPLPALKDASATTALPNAVEKIDQLSSKTEFLRIRPLQGTNHPFYTLYFQPPPPPPPKPTVPVTPEPPKPPPPPPMKKLALLYQGVYQTAAGGKKAFLQIDNKLSILSTGAVVAADWVVADIGLKTLTLTNHSAQTNVVTFDKPAEIEVPAK